MSFSRSQAWKAMSSAASPGSVVEISLPQKCLLQQFCLSWGGQNKLEEDFKRAFQQIFFFFKHPRCGRNVIYSFGHTGKKQSRDSHFLSGSLDWWFLPLQRMLSGYKCLFFSQIYQYYFTLTWHFSFWRMLEHFINSVQYCSRGKKSWVLQDIISLFPAETLMV